MNSKTEEKQLINRITVEVPFYDIDAVQIVWHGNYLKYLESGREAFGKEFGLEYMGVYRHGYITPIADLKIRYLKTATMGERLVVETRYVLSKAAKLIFDYTIYKESDHSVVLEATTIQLFMTAAGEFEISAPDFYRSWQQSHGF
ncbi:acyl-CoA thioesterase [Parabacteroides sp. OttesenSCG-928-N08]|nr:acyl-CoA thioesterase [Parabacteroides sp. OttesenSCG-928-N08]